VPRRRTRASDVAERRRPSVDSCARRGTFSSVDESSWLGRRASVAVREGRVCKQCLHSGCRARRPVRSRRAGKDPSWEHNCISTASCPLLSSQLLGYLCTRISKSGLLAYPSGLQWIKSHILSSPCSIPACSHDISRVMTSYTRVGDIIAHGSNVRSSSLAIGENAYLTVTAIVPNLQSDGRAFGHGHRVQEVPHLPSSQAHYSPS
jgi:hypothetical protein